MSYFLYAIIILLTMSVIGKISWIADDDYPKRSRKMEVWDVALNSLLIIWAVNLLT